MNTALLYVSSRLVPYPDVGGAILDIIAVSTVRNAELQVTGALIATPCAFAQILEGPEASINALMISIRKDERHRAVRILSEGPAHGRRFERWSLVYWGASTYVASHVEPLAALKADEVSDAPRVLRLISLMDAFRDSERHPPPLLA